jgi:hypothetical protein
MVILAPNQWNRGTESHHRHGRLLFAFSALINRQSYTCSIITCLVYAGAFCGYSTCYGKRQLCPLFAFILLLALLLAQLIEAQADGAKQGKVDARRHLDIVLVVSTSHIRTPRNQLTSDLTLTVDWSRTKLCSPATVWRTCAIVTWSSPRS